MHVTVSLQKTVQRAGISKDRVHRVVYDALTAGLQDRGNTDSYDVCVHFIGDRRMRTLYRTWYGKDAVTDVLSFPW